MSAQFVERYWAECAQRRLFARHALRLDQPNITTMGIYAHAVDRKKRSVQSKVVQMVLPKDKAQEVNGKQEVTP